MRIVSRPDFDGIVCAMLLYEAENITEPVKWLEPSEVQKGDVEITNEDIIANLPFDNRCLMWFDHHYSNQTDRPFKGRFSIAPSAARVIFEFYQGRFKRDYSELVAETDKIDSADFTTEEVLHPEKHPYILLSMTISGRADQEQDYWNKLIDLLRASNLKTLLSDPEVRKRCDQSIQDNIQYVQLLKNHTRVEHEVSVTDFRALNRTPNGNRFMVYSLFPETYVNVCILIDEIDQDKIRVKVGHSIFNKTCKVNVGQMLSDFGGGGHRGAGSCSLPAGNADKHIRDIIDILIKNAAMD
jgi:hypothetical protein